MNGDSKKGLSLYDLLYGNQSAEADSLQQDAIRRLQEGGLIGKQGEALVDKLTFDPSDTGPIIGQNPTTELDENLKIQPSIAKKWNRSNDGLKYTFTIHDDITKNTVSGNYTHDLNDFKTKCTPHATNHQFCSPCVKHCLECKEPLLCKWIKSPEDQEKLRDEFINEPFFIGVMPENKSALIVWNETRSDISKYLIFVYKKSEVNLNTKDVQQSPLIVKTIERDFKQVGSNSHIIKGLVNGEKYSITVNKVSNHPIPSVKSSNTIDVVPSIVTLVNFSDFNKDNSLKQDMLKSTNFFNNLKNKNFEITI